ncbi:60S ribosomal protein L31 [Candidatus Woesearchaeota archaeon]|nr:60S ribosomal protein L31 [Candidatus Woesearchaeota archaeon]
MAKKEEASVLERVYNVPLRKEFQKAPPWKRTKKAVKALRQFIMKHMKSKEVLIGKYANKFLWERGIKNPPHHVKVTATKDKKGKVIVELTEIPNYAKREIEKQKKLAEKKKGREESKKKEPIKEEPKLEAKIEEKVEEAKKEKEEKAKETEKEEIKELKKEHPKQHIPKQAIAPKKVEQRPTAPKGQ